MSKHQLYDFNHQIKINYTHRPTIDLVLINPLRHSYKTVNVENAIIDSGADRVCVPESYGKIIGHDISATKANEQPVNLGGIADCVTGFKHSAELLLLNPATNEPIDFLTSVNTDIYFTAYRGETEKKLDVDHPMLLGRNGFFDHFLVTFYTTPTEKFVKLTPKASLVSE